MRLIIFAGCLFFSSIFGFASPSEQEKIAELASSKYWLRLLHYKRGFPWIHHKSQADGMEFFFSPNGRWDAKAELLATIDAFSQDDKKVGLLKLHPQCAFPERYRFLKSELGLKIKDVSCPEFKEFITRFNAESATLLFSSALPNNPGSLFGHTFLRINTASSNKGDQKKLDILDWGISFAANVNGENGIEYAIRGLFGGFLGIYSLLPYYAKINEYTNMESRDIWEYDLALNREQTNRMLSHLWELLNNTYFDYFFLDENCAYELLTLLEIARVDWDITDFGIYIIPGETVKRVASVPGAVTKVNFRPSLRKKMLQRYEALSSQGREVFYEVISHAREPQAVKSPMILETASTYLYYLKQKEEKKFSEANASLLRSVLMRRSELGESSINEMNLPPVDEGSRPEVGHHTYRLGTAFGNASSGNLSGARYFQELAFKFAFHDLLNYDPGYLSFSQIDFPSVRVRYFFQSKRLLLDEIDGITVTSLFPLSFIESRPSWKVHAYVPVVRDFSCDNCHVFHGEAGGGVTINMFTPDWISFGMLLGYAQLGPGLREGYRMGPKAQLGTVARLGRYKTLFTGSVVGDFIQRPSKRSRPWYFYEVEWSQGYTFNQWWEVRTSVLASIPSSPLGIRYTEGKLTANFYF